MDTAEFVIYYSMDSKNISDRPVLLLQSGGNGQPLVSHVTCLLQSFNFRHQDSPKLQNCPFYHDFCQDQ